MAEFVHAKFDGVAALTKRIDALKVDVRFKGGRAALGAAARVVRDQIRQNAARVNDPQTPESIAKNVVERFASRSSKASGNPQFRVGVLGGAKSPGDPGAPGGSTFHWRFVEFGTEKMAAQPIVRPAGEQSAQAAIDKFAVVYGRYLDKLAKVNA